MDTGSVQVLRVEVTPEGIDFDHPTAGADISEALAAITGSRSFRPPLIKERIAVELAGVPTAVANALRRAVKEEIRGRCLTFDAEGFDREGTTDPFMEDEFVRTRLRMIPLRPQISEAQVKGLRFALDAENDTDKVMTIYSGDLVSTGAALTEPIFNPTHELAFLQPGRTLRINDIRLAEGYGYMDAAFAVGVRAASRPLDLEEVPREMTHSQSGTSDGTSDGLGRPTPASAQSGYTASSLVANPRRHEVSVYFPAVPAGGRASVTVLVDTCGAIMERLRFIQKVLEDAQARSAAGAADSGGVTHRASNAYFLVTPDGPRTKGVLSVKNETDTIGNLLARSVFELMPDISYVGYTCIPHEKALKLTVAHPVAEPGEIGPIVIRAVRHAYGVFALIQRGIKATL